MGPFSEPLFAGAFLGLNSKRRPNTAIVLGVSACCFCSTQSHACQLLFDSLSVSVTELGGTKPLAAQTDCDGASLQPADVNWFRVVRAYFDEGGTPLRILLAIDQNASPDQRVGHVLIRGSGNVDWQTITVTQAGVPVGACCVGGSICNTNVSLSVCVGLNGAWQGAGSTACTQCDPTGSCCVGASTCITRVTQAYCSSQGGRWQGNDSTTCQNCPDGSTTLSPTTPAGPPTTPQGPTTPPRTCFCGICFGQATLLGVMGMIGLKRSYKLKNTREKGRRVVGANQRQRHGKGNT